MSFSETIFLFFLALIVFGPKKLPEIARQAGKLLAELRRASNEFKSQIEQEISHLEAEKTILPPSQPPAGSVATRSLNAAPSDNPEAASLAGPSADGTPMTSTEAAELPPVTEAVTEAVGAPDSATVPDSQESHA